MLTNAYNSTLLPLGGPQDKPRLWFLERQGGRAWVLLCWGLRDQILSQLLSSCKYTLAQGVITTYHRLADLNRKNLFLTLLEAGNSNIKVMVDSDSHKDTLSEGLKAAIKLYDVGAGFSFFHFLGVLIPSWASPQHRHLFASQRLHLLTWSHRGLDNMSIWRDNFSRKLDCSLLCTTKQRPQAGIISSLTLTFHICNVKRPADPRSLGSEVE